MARNIRVNQSHFAMIPQANIRRSVFDRSHVYKTTFNEGQLILFNFVFFFCTFCLSIYIIYDYYLFFNPFQSIYLQFVTIT